MMKKLLTVLFAAAVFGVVGQSFEDELSRVETWINTTYRSSPRALKSATDKLDKICASEKNEQGKIAELRKTFPKAFPPAVIENLIVTEPLVWKIHSLSLGYDIQEGSAAKTKTVDIEKELSQQDANRQDSKSDMTIDTKSRVFGLKGDVSARVSLNPLNWLPQTSGSISGHYEKNSSDRVESGSVWNEKKQQMFQLNREKILSMINQTTIKNLHLTFTVTLYNPTDSKLTFDLASAEIPVYMGKQSCNKMAKPFDVSSQVLVLRPKNVSGQDVVFRMELNTTKARELVDFMSKDTPTITLEKGSVRIENSSREDMLTKRNTLPESSPVVLSWSAGSLSWRIRRFHALDGKVSIGEACEAISQDVKNYKDPLFNKNTEGRLDSVSGVPFGKFKIQDNAGEIAFLEYQGNIHSELSADLLGKPIGYDRLTIYIVDIATLDQISNSKLINAIIEQYNRINGTKEFKGALAYQIALYYKENRYDTELVKWLKKSADLGNVFAHKELGNCFYFGTGVRKQYSEAVKWYRMAAGQGYANAQHNLGNCYYNGEGVSRDYAEAVKWYRKAADQGLPHAQFALGRCYYNGEGVSQDYAEAVKWYRKAADQGYALAQYALGVCYERGEGVSCDYAEAVKWYRKVAEKGNVEALWRLGFCYYTGKGISQDYNEAVKWYRKAAEKGNIEALWRLGLCYFGGKGVTQDYNEAVKWFRKAAEKGNRDGQMGLGICYLYGHGVSKDRKEAVKWFQKAAEQGDEKAKEVLKTLNE